MTLLLDRLTTSLASSAATAMEKGLHACPEQLLSAASFRPLASVRMQSCMKLHRRKVDVNIVSMHRA